MCINSSKATWTARSEVERRQGFTEGGGPDTLAGMALERSAVGSLTHAELVDLVIRQAVLIDQLQATVGEQQALIGRLEARVRELETERDRNDPTKKMPGLKPAATPRRRKTGPRKRREATLVA